VAEYYLVWFVRYAAKGDWSRVCQFLSTKFLNPVGPGNGPVQARSALVTTVVKVDSLRNGYLNPQTSALISASQGADPGELAMSSISLIHFAFLQLEVARKNPHGMSLLK